MICFVMRHSFEYLKIFDHLIILLDNKLLFKKTRTKVVHKNESQGSKVTFFTFNDL